MPDQLTDFRITKAYEGKSGEGKYGPWTIYNFYTDKTEKERFSYFGGKGKIIPMDGMEIAYMEYETKQDGDYTNYDVKKLVPKEDKITPEAIPNAKEDQGPIPQTPINKSVSMYDAYMKDIAVAIITVGGNLETADLDSIAKRIGRAGLIMMNESLNNGQISSEKPKKAPPVEDNDKPVQDATQIEADRKLRAILKTYAKRNNKEYFRVLGMHGAESAEQVIGFEEEAQAALLKDLDKAFDEIPF